MLNYKMTKKEKQQEMPDLEEIDKNENEMFLNFSLLM
jgi:hypothetical protein